MNPDGENERVPLEVIPPETRVCDQWRVKARKKGVALHGRRRAAAESLAPPNDQALEDNGEPSRKRRITETRKQFQGKELPNAKPKRRNRLWSTKQALEESKAEIMQLAHDQQNADVSEKVDPVVATSNSYQEFNTSAAADHSTNIPACPGLQKPSNSWLLGPPPAFYGDFWCNAVWQLFQQQLQQQSNLSDPTSSPKKSDSDLQQIHDKDTKP